MRKIKKMSFDIFFIDWTNGLLDDNLRASSGAASEEAFFDLLEGDDTGFFGVNGEVAAHVGAGTGYFGCTGLADEDFAFVDLLATKALNTKARTGIVVDVL